MNGAQPSQGAGLVDYLARVCKRAEAGDERALVELERWTRMAERWTARAVEPGRAPAWVRFLTGRSE